MPFVTPLIRPEIDAALTRWEYHGRPGLSDRGFALSRPAGRQRRGIYRVDTGTPVFETDEHILRMAPSPDRNYIALQLAERADENAQLAVLDCAAGELRRYPEVRCRYDPMLWHADGGTLDLFARPSRRHVTLRADTGDITTVATPGAAARRLFPGGRAGLVAESRADGPTVLIDRATGGEIARFPAIVRVEASGETVIVDDGECLHAIDECGAARWSWDDPGATVTSWTTVGDRVFAAAVRAGDSVLLELDDGRVVAEQVTTYRGEPAVATEVGSDGGEVTVVVEAPTMPPRIVPLAQLRDSACGDPVAGPCAARTEWCAAVAEDGAQIRVVVTSPAAAHGPGPLILTCYGGFGVPSLPVFEPSVPAWIEHGGRYAIAQVRGGGEHGAAWREAGRGERKHRAVDDLACAARRLIDAGYTRPDQLVLAGASHGGVLAASCGLGHPGLCAGIVSTAAPLDLLNVGSHPLGRRWISEFGSPDTPEGRERLRAISPLHRARAAARHPAPLPRFLGVVFEEDSRVAASDTHAVVMALRHAGGDATLWQAPKTGHGSNHLDRVHRFAAVVLSFAARAAGPVPAAAR